MKHLRVTFIDGTVEDLESKYEYVTAVGEVITTRTERVGGFASVGPTYSLYSVRKYEWVEGYK